MSSLDISPTRMPTHRVATVTFIGVGTTWTSGAPTFSVSDPSPPSNADLVAAISMGSVTVVSDTIATVPVTYCAAAADPLTAAQTLTGVVKWTDSTTSKTVNQIVTFAARRLVRQRS